MQFKSSFLKEAQWRGFIHQATDIEALDELMANESIVAYIGFDPTGDSLHVGHMVSIMLLRLLQKHGHKPIALLGGATAKIGDPTGKDAMRQALSDEQIEHNAESLKDCFKPYLNFDNIENNAIMLNNADWLSKLNYLEFLSTYGRHFSINRMLTFDSVKTRLEREQPLSFLEFNYMIFQGYDFVELSKTYNCVLQCGGSDQWGNIVSGVDLGRRILNKSIFGFTTPLVTTSGGAKMGKTEKGAVWLKKDKLSPFDYWQFWRNTEDADVIKYLKLFTDLDFETIQSFEHLKFEELNDIKKLLADETTKILHGVDCLDEIHTTIKTLYEKGSGSDLSQLPTFEIEKDVLLKIPIEDLFVFVNLCASKGEARRLIDGKGARIQDNLVQNGKDFIDISVHNDNLIKLSSGKKKHHVLKVL
ncbi:MAG: tyrosine--tRNA ligase [Proteobacteria bacterium]|nr:tyrosine--tRNA ligase [Pseudomonadota bacterium]